jgi:hypothetical protein
MKKQFLIILFILFSLIMNAQEIKVKEDKENLGGDINPVMTVLIYEADESDVEKAWKSLMKDYDAKISSVKSVFFADNAMIPEISANTVDIYEIAKKQPDGIKLIVAFDLGGAYISSSTHPAAYKTAENIIKKFAVNLSIKAVQEKLNDAKDKQKDLEDNLSGLIKKNERLHGDIEDYKNNITEAEIAIEKNLKDQLSTTQSIELQKKVVQEVQLKLGNIR